MQKLLKSDCIKVNEVQQIGDRFQNEGSPFCFGHADIQSLAMQCSEVKVPVAITGICLMKIEPEIYLEH